jgi:hypothetical protein
MVSAGEQKVTTHVKQVSKVKDILGLAQEWLHPQDVAKRITVMAMVAAVVQAILLMSQTAVAAQAAAMPLSERLADVHALWPVVSVGKL